MPIPLTLSRLQLCNWGFQCGVLQTVSPMILIYRVSQKEWHKVPENTKWFLSPKLCFIFSIVSIIIQSDSTKYLLTQSKMWNPDNFVLSSCHFQRPPASNHKQAWHEMDYNILDKLTLWALLYTRHSKLQLSLST